MIQYLFAAVALDALGGIYDAVKTEQGLKKGLAKEGNSVINKLFGNTPSAVQLYMYNFAQLSLFAGLAFLGVTKGTENVPYISFGGGIIALLVDAAKHVQGGL